MKKDILLLIFTLILSNSAHATKFINGKNMSILHKQPIYSIKINTFGIKYILKINGVTILKENSSSSQLTTSIPVNHWMKSGSNTMEVHIRPPQKGEEYNPGAKLNYELTVKSNLQPDSNFTVTNINLSGASANIKNVDPSGLSGTFDSSNKFTPSDSGDVTISDVIISEIPTYKGGLVISREIYAESTIPLWSFFESDDIPDIDSMSDEDYYNELDTLLTEYMKIHSAIESNNITSILPLFDERNKETDEAYYSPQGETERKLNDSLTSTVNDSTLELLELDRNKVIFTIEQNRKLARLTRKGTTPAISLNYKDGGSIRYDIYFRLKNNKWILTR